MEPFHSFLPIQCGDCKEALIRIAQSQFHDLVVCPCCLAAGLYDDVVENGAILRRDYEFTDEIKSYLRQWRDSRPH